MKKRLSLLAGLLLGPLLVFAQDSTQVDRSVGISFGLFPHGSTVSSDLIDYEWDANLSFSAGVCIPFTRKLTLTGDFQFLHTGSNTSLPPDPPNELIRERSIRDRFVYLQLAAGARYYLSDRIYAGAYTGPALHIYTERLTIQKYFSGFELEERQRYDFGEGDVREINWFAGLGIGYELPLSNYIGITFEPSAYMSLASIDSRSDLDARAFGVGLRTAIVFKKFKRNVNMKRIPAARKK